MFIWDFIQLTVAPLKDTVLCENVSICFEHPKRLPKPRILTPKRYDEHPRPSRISNNYDTHWRYGSIIYILHLCLCKGGWLSSRQIQYLLVFLLIVFQSPSPKKHCIINIHEFR